MALCFGGHFAPLLVGSVLSLPSCSAGTFQQLVLTDSLSALVASPPLLYVTNARRFTDWRLVFTAVTFQVSSAVVCTPMFC